MPRSARFEHLVAYVIEHPWAITDGMRQLIANVVARRLAGEDTDEEGLVAARQARETRAQAIPTGGTVAVIPVHGVLAPRMNLFSEVSGGATYEGLTSQLHEAVADPNVHTILFDVDSPGGNVAGASEMAREVLKARTQKPVIAQAAHMMCSAAYWVMSGATEIVASPSALVGSIGVYGIYDDLSAALEQLGVKRTVLSAGKYKAEGIGGVGLNAEAQAHLQSLINGAYGRFVGDVAKGRGVSAAAVRDGYGEGRAIDGDRALTLGMIDRIATLSDTLARVTQPAAAGSLRGSTPLPPTATRQEPTPASATRQELPAAAPVDAQMIEFQRRALALVEKGLRR
jgi:signal peptide peptidase SppA